MRPGWISAWLEAFGTGQPQVFTVRRDGELVALLPMERRRGRLRSPSNWHSPVFGPLATDAEARDQLLAAVFSGSRPSVELSFLDGDDASPLQIDRAARASGRLVLGRPIAWCPVVDISGSFEDYLGGLSRNRRKSLKRGRRLLEAAGSVTFDVHRGVHGLDRALRELFAVECSGWKGSRGTAISSCAHTERFYTEVARWAAERGWLQLSFLRFDGHAIACDYSIEFQGVQYSLKSGYDEEYRAFGPGALLLRDQLEECFARALSRMELLGTEDPFKLSWTNRSSDRTRLHAFSRSSAGLAHWSRVAGRESLRPAVHWVRQRMRTGLARGTHAVGGGLGLEPLLSAL
ncbi:MAG: hypothetical protein QOH58_1285 [Thermoleophilaceae bacterium]|nr:hypothetical protein [Thermoleophilaceae bacterium]